MKFMQTSSKMLKRRLKNVEFPCYVSIIVSDAFNLTTLRSHFYLTPFAYLMGRKKNNSDNLLWYDWSGNNSTVKGTHTFIQGDYDGRGQQTASPMFTAIMSGGVGISGRELSTQLINS